MANRVVKIQLPRTKSIHFCGSPNLIARIPSNMREPFVGFLISRLQPPNKKGRVVSTTITIDSISMHLILDLFIYLDIYIFAYIVIYLYLYMHPHICKYIYIYVHIAHIL